MNVREVRKKIKSIKNVKKITKAMQMVSAVKMRKAQQLEHESRPYREGLTELIGRLAKKIDGDSVELLKIDTTKAKRELVILVTSNKGLAGPFNVNLFRYILKHGYDFHNVDFIIIGLKGAQFVGRLQGCNILASYVSNTPLNEASALFEFALSKYRTGEYKQVSIIYNKFISTLKSEVAEDVLLPFAAIETIEKPDLAKASPGKENTMEYMIEPSAAEILEQLLLSFLETKIRGAMISSAAVEHSARMMAMKSATDNATDIIYSLTLLGNKLRQQKITYELLDMITAKESVDA